MPPGTSASCRFDQSGTPSDPTVYRAEALGSVRCTGKVFVTADHVRIEGVLFTDATGARSGSGVTIQGNHVTLKNCEIHTADYNGAAIGPDTSTTLVENCHIHDVGRSGVFVYPTAREVTLRGNRFIRAPDRDNLGHGIYVKGAATSRTLVEDNVFDTARYGNSISFRGPGIIRRNLIKNSDKNGIYLLDDTGTNPGSSVLIENNIVVGHRWAGLRVGGNVDGWNITVQNNTIIGTTTGVIIQPSWESLKLLNNVIGVTGPPVSDCPSNRIDCRSPVYAARFPSAGSYLAENNLYFNRHDPSAMADRGLKSSESAGDPGFSTEGVVAEDFLPEAGLPSGDLLIDQGQAIGDLTEDFAGRPRPVSACDIGAWEVQASSPPPADPPESIGKPGRPAPVAPGA